MYRRWWRVQMSAESDLRTANLLGALGLMTGDEVNEASRKAADGSPSAAAALVLLRTLTRCNIDALAHFVNLTHSGAVRLVDRLEAEGLVKRRPGVDGRSLILELTRKGDTRAGEIIEARRAVVADKVGLLDDAERVQLTRLLEKMLAGSIVDPDMDWRTCRLCDVPACVAGECPVAAAVERLEQAS